MVRVTAKVAIGVLVGLVLLCLPAAAPAAKHCDVPVAGPQGWERATPEQAGLDAAAVADAMDYGTSQASFAIRVYRHGCLVAEDALAGSNKTAQYESWSMAKSITSLVFGRAMSLGLISPDDPVGSLVPEADEAHGRITVRDLLTMTSGLRWNGLRDYNIFMPDRVRDALVTPVVREPGTYWEYSQSGPALLAESVQRAVGEDFQAFAQRELFGPIGITPGSWGWTRDSVGHTQGFFGVQMVPDDYARLGELMRRGGVWSGRRLLSKRYVRQAVRPIDASGCYGWLIWLNKAQPCVGVRISDRPVRDHRRFPEAPADAFFYSGLFGQLVTVFPTQGIVIQRNGQDASVAGGADWEAELYRRILGAITDEPFTPPADAPPSGTVDRSDPDQGFQTALAEPDQVLAPGTQTELPPAGPARARALVIASATTRATRRGVVRLRVSCPPQWPGAPGAGRCAGDVRLAGARRRAPVRLAAGASKRLRFRMGGRARGARRVVAVLRDGAGGTRSARTVRVRRARR